MISNTGMFSDQGPDNDKECLHKMFPLNDAVIKRVRFPGRLPVLSIVTNMSGLTVTALS